jgi:putative oxidoreductase
MKTPSVGYCINWILRLLVGGAFVFAGVLKIADPAKFALDVSNYRLVPHELLNLVAILVPWIEITAGSFVLAGTWLRAAAFVITGLTAMFFAVIVSALARGLNIECGCFGTIGGKHIGLVNLAIDSTLLCLAALLARRSKDYSGKGIFRDAAARNSEPPLEASSAIERGSRSFVYMVTQIKRKNRPLWTIKHKPPTTTWARWPKMPAP